jgi:hypothetical protein
MSGASVKKIFLQNNQSAGTLSIYKRKEEQRRIERENLKIA